MSDKVDKVKTLLALMQSKAEEFDRAGLDEEAQSIYNSIKYLNDMKSDNDRLLFIESTPDFKNWMLGNVSGNDAETQQVKDIKTAIDEEGAARRDLEYDDEGNRVLTRSEIMKELGVDENSPSVAFGVDSEKSLYKMKPERIRAMARSLGVSTQDFIKAYYDEAKKYEQNKAVNDGTISGKITKAIFGRSTKKLEEGKDISPVDAALDVAEYAASFSPIGGGIKGVSIGGKVADKALKVAGVPTLGAIGDATIGDGIDAERTIGQIANNGAFYGAGKLVGSGILGAKKIPNFIAKLTNGKIKLRSAPKKSKEEIVAEGDKVYSDANALLKRIDDIKGSQQYGTSANYTANMTPEELKAWEKFQATGVTENPALNDVFHKVAVEITNNPKATNVQNAVAEAFKKVRGSKKRTDIVKRINTEAGIVDSQKDVPNILELNGTRIDRFKDIPTATDEFVRLFKNSPYAELLDRMGENEKKALVRRWIRDGAVAEIANNTRSFTPTAYEQVKSFAKSLGDEKARKDKEAEEEQKRKQEMTNKHIQQLQAGWRKAMGMN